MDAPRVIIVNDDQNTGNLLAEICSNCNYIVRTATSAKAFISIYDDVNPELILLDLQLGDVDGIELLRYLVDAKCSNKMIILSNHKDKWFDIEQKIGKDQRLNIVGFIQKPFHTEQLVSLLESIKWSTESISIEAIADAIEAKEIILYYQPKISLLNNQIVGVEALARWQHNSHLILPDRFIPLAEASHLMRSLTNTIIEKAFSDYHDFQCGSLSISLSINLSGKDLTDDSFPNRIRSLAKQHNIDPGNICFELKENTIMAPDQHIIDILSRLKLIGFMLSIDNFGTGYSSLTDLRKIPFNEIKIDKSFVFNLLHDKDAQIITRSIIDLGQNFGLITTAEGVESKEVLEKLRDYHCNVAQGYYFSKPLPPSDLAEWMTHFIADN